MPFSITSFTYSLEKPYFCCKKIEWNSKTAIDVLIFIRWVVDGWDHRALEIGPHVTHF